MGAQMTKEEFDEVCAPILAQKETPPSWYKPQKCQTTGKADQGGVGGMTLAFLEDGTIAGKVNMGPIGILRARGIFKIDPETREVTTNMEMSMKGEKKEDDKKGFLVDGNGLMQAQPAGPEAPVFEFIQPGATAEEFLPPAPPAGEDEAGQAAMLNALGQGMGQALAEGGTQKGGAGGKEGDCKQQ